jgi:rubrerythrin
MGKSVKGTKTEQNLLKAFAGESQARYRYTYFASAARKEGYEQIANIFMETAENEKEHAKVFFKFLEGGDLEITASYPAGMISDTKANLEEAAAGENLEWTTLYADFSKTAKDEGFPDIARAFEQIARSRIPRVALQEAREQRRE